MKKSIDYIYNHFSVALIDEATTNTLACKRFYTSVIAKDLRLNNNWSTATNGEINNFSATDIINENIDLLLTKFFLKLSVA